MQFLAFLRDSYREARSGWVLQTMLALAVLLVIFVAGVSFRPLTLEDTVNRQYSLFLFFLRQNPQHPQAHLVIENFVQSNQAEPWKSDYDFDCVVKAASAADLDFFRKMPILPTDPSNALHQFHQQFTMLKKVETSLPAAPAEAEGWMALCGGAIVPAQPWTPTETRVHVHTSGTNVDDALGWPHEITILYGFTLSLSALSLRDGVFQLESYLVNGIGSWILLFVAVIVTAGFIPNLLARGTFDLAISKPIGRPRLLVYKYVGGLIFVFLITTAVVIGVWVAIGLRTGLWGVNFLAVLPILTLYFAILYAVSTTAAVFTRSALVAILATGLAWGLLWGIGKVNAGIEHRLAREAELAEKQLELPNPNDPNALDDLMIRIAPDAPLWGFIPKSWFPVFTALHAVSPRTYQLDARLDRLIAEGVLTPSQLKAKGYGQPPRDSWAWMIGVSFTFIAVMLALSSWRLTTRDG